MKLRIHWSWQGLLDTKEIGYVDTLVFIHKTLFQDIYAIAGQARDVSMIKCNFYFTSVRHLLHSLENIDRMSQFTVAEIFVKYVEMNIVYPF
ncbi:cell filamentation protein [Streptococcus sp. 10F2]